MRAVGVTDGTTELRTGRRPEPTRPHGNWCERGDSNPHALRRQNLNLVRLPIPPLSQCRNAPVLLQGCPQRKSGASGCRARCGSGAAQRRCFRRGFEALRHAKRCEQLTQRLNPDQARPCCTHLSSSRICENSVNFSAKADSRDERPISPDRGTVARLHQRNRSGWANHVGQRQRARRNRCLVCGPRDRSAMARALAERGRRDGGCGHGRVGERHRPGIRSQLREPGRCAPDLARRHQPVVRRARQGRGDPGSKQECLRPPRAGGRLSYAGQHPGGRARAFYQRHDACTRPRNLTSDRAAQLARQRHPPKFE